MKVKPKTLKNKARCNLCDCTIESKHIHHFVSCNCGEIFVDGGTDYYRQGAKDFNNFIDLSVYPETAEESE